MNNNIQEAIIDKRRHVSIVWLIPLVAALIGGWLVYKAISERGPTINIIFKSAEGLEANKTKIKYKNVELGQVESITLNDDLTEVNVRARMVSGTEKYLTNKTRFWIVRARVAAGEVSGIGTLLTGAYIGIDPVTQGEPTHNFVGLDQPPAVTTDENGRHFTLRAKSLGSLDVGSPVFYRKIKVGQVVAYKLDPDGESVTLQIFIKSPLDRLVYTNTRFWNAGGIDVNVDANGVKINMESITTLLVGGISFDIPQNETKGGMANDSQTFTLYESHDQINERVFKKVQRWVVYFDSSVRGLKEGAPVEFRGIKIGKVVDIRMEYNQKSSSVRIPVTIETEPGRISTMGNSSASKQRDIMDDFVKRGLRAQLSTGNILTGQLFVELTTNSKVSPATIDWKHTPYPEFPTTPQPIEEITNNLTAILAKIQQLPIDKIGHELEQTLHGTNKLVNAPELHQSMEKLEKSMDALQASLTTINGKITPQVSQVLAQSNDVLKSMKSLIDEHSPINQQMNDLLKELTETARSFKQVADYLQRHPEALVKGKPNN